MRIISWARLAPSLSSISNRCAITTMAVDPTRSSASPSPAWTSLLQQGIARHKNDPTAKYCQLATAAIGGGASCRTWVFRGFYEDKGALKFITDRRSQKIREIAADPAGEVCFYLKKTREQFRIRGRLQVVDAGESDEILAKARGHQWGQISPASQASFATSLIPGLEVPSEPGTSPSDNPERLASSEMGPETTAVEGTGMRGRASGHGRMDNVNEEDSSKELVSEDFCLVLLWPNFVDHLRLGERQSRDVYKIAGDRDGGGALLTGKAAAVAAGTETTAEGATAEAGGVPHTPVAWDTKAVNP